MSFRKAFVDDVQKQASNTAARGKHEGPGEDLFEYSKSSPGEEGNSGRQLERALGSTEVLEEKMINRMKAYGWELETLEHIVERWRKENSLCLSAMVGAATIDCGSCEGEAMKFRTPRLWENDSWAGIGELT